MMVVVTIAVLAIFLFVGWAVATEMFQHRAWRKRVESGDLDIVRALLEEAMSSWRVARPPKGTAANLWAGVQAAQLVSVDDEGGATVSSSAEGEFRAEGSERVQVASNLDEAIALASRLADMLLYDVPNLRLDGVRVDIYSTFTGLDGTPRQQPILSTVAPRQIADLIAWEELTPEEVLGRFETDYDRAPNGQGRPIELRPVRGALYLPVAEPEAAGVGTAAEDGR